MAEKPLQCGLESIDLSGAKSIKSDAFLNCEELVSVVLGKKLTTVGEDAFHGCQKLTEITFPEKVKTIQCGYFLFKHVHFLAKTPGNYWIYKIGKDTVFHVPEGCAEAYKKEFPHITFEEE